MVRVQVEMSEEDRERFSEQAKREGKTLDAWLVSVGRQHSAHQTREYKPFKSREELNEFWRWCESLQDGEREPDWEEHLRNMDKAIREGLPDV